MTLTRQQNPLQGEHKDGDRSCSQSFLWMPSTRGVLKEITPTVGVSSDRGAVTWGGLATK